MDISKEQKTAKGGLSFELFSKEPDAEMPPLTPRGEKVLSEVVIKTKLEQAETRRKTAEAERLEKLSQHISTVQEVRGRQSSNEKEFKEKTAAEIAKKLENAEDNRDQKIKELKERLKTHFVQVESVREKCIKALDEANNDSASIAKLEIANKRRDDNLKMIQEKLQEHLNHVSTVLNNMEQMKKETEQKVITQQEKAMKLREEQVEQLLTRLKEKNEYAEVVRARKQSNTTE